MKGITGGEVNNTGLELTPLSKPFKTREQAEKAREKYPERLRKRDWGRRYSDKEVAGAVS
jgi:hypothetical protein